VTWDDQESSRQAVLALVKQKMAEGYTFLVLKPRLIPLFGTKKVPLTSDQLKDPNFLHDARGVVVPDALAQETLSSLNSHKEKTAPVKKASVDDTAVASLIASNVLSLQPRNAKVRLADAQRASTPEQVVAAPHSLCMRPLVGG